MSLLRVHPKGTRVAVLSVSGGSPVNVNPSMQIVVVERDGTRRTLISWPAITGLAWSASGDEVWFSGTQAERPGTLNAVTLAGRERVVMRTPGECAAS